MSNWQKCGLVLHKDVYVIGYGTRTNCIGVCFCNEKNISPSNTIGKRFLGVCWQNVLKEYPELKNFGDIFRPSFIKTYCGSRGKPGMISASWCVDQIQTLCINIDLYECGNGRIYGDFKPGYGLRHTTMMVLDLIHQNKKLKKENEDLAGAIELLQK